MPYTIRKLTVTMTTGVSVTSAFDLGGGEFNQFAIVLPNPTNYMETASVNIRLQGSDSPTGTFHFVRYSQNPATALSNSGNAPWEVCVHTSGIVMCEAMPFVRYAKINTLLASTSGGALSTNTTDFIILMRHDK